MPGHDIAVCISWGPAPGYSRLKSVGAFYAAHACAGAAGVQGVRHRGGRGLCAQGGARHRALRGVHREGGGAVSLGFCVFLLCFGVSD